MKIYNNLEEVLADPLFPPVDLALRRGEHIGVENPTWASFLESATEYLGPFYRSYGAQLRREGSDLRHYFFLSIYGKLIKTRKLPIPTMVAGLTLGFLMTDPLYINKQVPVDKMVENIKMLIGEDQYFAIFVNRRRGRDSDRDSKKAVETIEKAVRQLDSLGFVLWQKGTENILLQGPLTRFIDPIIAGVGEDEDVITTIRRMAALDPGIAETGVDDSDDEQDDNGDES